MRSRRAVAGALVLAGLWLASAAGPFALSDAGPHVHYGWGEAIRLRHLYTAGPHGPSSCFLRIGADGAVDCARGQSAHSECPPRPSPAQRPSFPLPSSAPAGLPIPRSPGLGTSEFALLGSRDSARRWGRAKRVRGPTAPCVNRPSRPSPCSGGPPTPGTLGFDTSAFHDPHPESSDSAGSWGHGRRARAPAPTAPTCCGCSFLLPLRQLWWRSGPSPCGTWPSRACTAPATSAWAPTAGCEGW